MSTNAGDSKPRGGASGKERVPTNGAHQSHESAESWVSLCARAAVEDDPRRLLELVKQINRLLDARRLRLADEVNKPMHYSGVEMADGKTHDSE